MEMKKKRKTEMTDIPETAVTKEAAVAFLKANDNYVIYTHAHPDADTVGSALALCKALISLGKRAYVCCTEKMPSFLRFLYDDGEIELNEERAFLQEPIPISVDVATIDLIGKSSYLTEHPIALAFDHHATHVPFAKRYLVDAASAACGEIIFDIVSSLLGGKMPADIAEKLYAAISADTGSFKYSNTTSKTLLIAAKLIETGIDASAISTHLFDEKSIIQLRAEGLAYSRMKLFAGGRGVIVSFDISDYNEYGLCEEELGTISSCIKTASGTDMAIAVRYHEDGEYKVSVRSSANVDASVFCRIFGGGGHSRASGCTVHKDSAKEVEELLICEAEKLIGAQKL